MFCAEVQRVKKEVGSATPVRARRTDPEPRRRRLGGGYVLGGVAACLAALVGMAAISTIGLTPWNPSDTGEVGIDRRVDPSSTTIAGEPAAATDEEITMPAHLMPRTPGYLGEPGTAAPKEEEAADEPPASSQTSSSRAAPASQAAPPTTTAPPPPSTTAPPPATTTTTVPASTTTAPPPTTTTLPPKQVAPPDGSPQAVADSYLIAPNTIVHLNVLDNDSDPDGAVSGLTVSLVSGPSHAYRFTFAGTYFRYRSYAESDSQFSPDDAFVYEICDADGNCDTATVTVTIDVG